MRWFILILITLSLACSKKQESAPVEPEQATEAEATSPAEGAELLKSPEKAAGFENIEMPPLPPELQAEAPPLGAPPTVIVLEQGSEPRQALRWTVRSGFEQKTTTDIGLGVNAVVGLVQTDMAETVISYDLSMQAKNVAKDGTIAVAFKVDDAQVKLRGGFPVQQTERQKKAMRQRADVAGSYALSARGAITNLEMTKASDGSPANAALIDSLQWALVQLTPALPEEPVGPGARWTVHESFVQGGIHAHQVRTVELVKVEGNRVELTMETRQTAGPQPYTNPLTGAKFDLESSNGVVHGSLDWDLSRLAPMTASIVGNAIDGAMYRDASKTKRAAIAALAKRSAKVGGK